MPTEQEISRSSSPIGASHCDMCGDCCKYVIVPAEHLERVTHAQYLDLVKYYRLHGIDVVPYPIRRMMKYGLRLPLVCGELRTDGKCDIHTTSKPDTCKRSGCIKKGCYK